MSRRMLLAQCLGLALLAWAAVCLVAMRLVGGEASLGLPLRVVEDTVMFAGDTALSQRPIESLSAPGHPALRLEPGDLDPEPTYLRLYTELARFLERQDRLAAILASGEVIVHFSDGYEARLRPSPRRPLSALPASFWEQLLLTLLPMLLAAAALAQRPKDPAAGCYAMCAVGYLLVVGAMAIYSARALALDATVFAILLGINHFAALVLLVGSGTALIWNYPRPLHRARGDLLILGVASLVALLHLLALPPSIDLGLRLPVLVFFVANLALAALQWRRSRGRAVDRAMLRWFLLAWFVGIGSYVALLVIPVLLGAPPLVDQFGGWIALLAIFLGLGFGITRFRLFYVNRAQILVWAGSGALVCLSYGLGIAWLELPRNAVLWTSLAVAGWLHVPLRDWIWSRFGGVHGGLRYELLLPRVLEHAAGAQSAATIEQRWRETLRELYRPQSIETNRLDPAHAQIVDDGAALVIPALPEGQPLRLSGASGGSGVFTPADLQLADSLWTLFAQVKDYRISFQRGVIDERTRLALDLDMRIDTPLRAMAPDTPPALAPLIEEARQELHAVVQSLSAADAPLAVHAKAWSEDLRHRCEAAGLALVLVNAVGESTPTLAGRVALNLRRVLREALTNVIRHAQARQLWVHLDWEPGLQRFHVCVEDDGRGFDPQTARAGRGLYNMRARAAELGGRIEWSPRPDGGTRMQLWVPLSTATGGNVLKLAI